MKQLTSWVSIFVLISILLNCGKDKPLPTGYSDIIGGKEGQIADTLIVQEQGNEIFYSRLINTGSSDNLLLGSYQHYHSAIYLKFDNLPDSVQIHSAKLYLTKASIDSTLSGSTQPFTVDFYHAKYEWENDQDPEQYLDQLPFNDLPFQSAEITTPDTLNTIAIELDTLVVSDWADTLSGLANYGFWLDSPDLEGINNYYSVQNMDVSVIPQLQLIFTITDSASQVLDTTIVYATKDAFLAPDTSEVLSNLDPDFFYIGKGLAFRSFLKFNLTGLDTTIHLNRALMEVVINRANSIQNISSASDIIIYRMEEETRIKNQVNENPTTSSYAGTLTDSTIIFDVTRTVQGWIGNNYVNNGFLVRSMNEQETLSRTAFYSSISSTEFQPKLYLYYTLPSKKEF